MPCHHTGYHRHDIHILCVVAVAGVAGGNMKYEHSGGKNEKKKIKQWVILDFFWSFVICTFNSLYKYIKTSAPSAKKKQIRSNFFEISFFRKFSVGMNGTRRRTSVYLGREETSCVGGRGRYVTTVKFFLAGRDGKFTVSRREGTVISSGRDENGGTGP